MACTTSLEEPSINIHQSPPGAYIMHFVRRPPIHGIVLLIDNSMDHKTHASLLTVCRCGMGPRRALWLSVPAGASVDIGLKSSEFNSARSVVWADNCPVLLTPPFLPFALKPPYYLGYITLQQLAIPIAYVVCFHYVVRTIENF